MHGVNYGIWLRSEHVRSRKDLATAMRTFFDASVPLDDDGISLNIIFIGRDQSCCLFEPGESEVSKNEPPRTWQQASQRAVKVLVQ